MTLGVKLAGGIFLTATSVFSGWIIHEKITPKTIQAQLEWEGRTILENNDNDEWEKILEKPENIDKLKKFLEVNNSEIKEEIEKLKNKCQEILGKNKTDQNFMKNAREFCSKAKKQ